MVVTVGGVAVRRRIALALCLLGLLLATCAVALYVRGGSRPHYYPGAMVEPPKFFAVLAAHDIRGGEVITERHVVRVPAPTKLEISELSQVVGCVALRDIPRGDTLRPEDVSTVGCARP